MDDETVSRDVTSASAAVSSPTVPHHLTDTQSTTVQDCSTSTVPASSPTDAVDFRRVAASLPVTSAGSGDGGDLLQRAGVDEVTSLYRDDEDGCLSSEHHDSSMNVHQMSPPDSRGGFTYSADSYRPPLAVNSDQPAALADRSYVVMSSEPSRAGLIDSYSMSLPPYPTSDVDQSKPVDRIPSYLPYAASRTPRTTESPVIYGRSVPAFPSEAFTKDFFGQYLHDAPPAPLHPLATHGSLHDQHAAAAGILGQYQQSSALTTMPHSTGSSELFRRAYSGVSDNLFGGMKSPSQATLGAAAQSQHWMTAADHQPRWNPTPPTMHSDMSRYNYPPGRTELADTAKTLPPVMSKRPDDVPAMFMTSSSGSSGSVYSPAAAGPPPYPHPALPSAVTPSQRQLEDAYRQMAAGDYRPHRSASEMYGNALSSLDRYYYSARDAMYRSQQLAAAMPHAFRHQTSISSSQYPPPPDHGAGYMSTYGQCPPAPAPPYNFICHEKQYLPGPTSSNYLDGRTAVSSQDSYTRHIYNMMPRYF